jgi:peptide/nickel transport system permease protein
MVPLSKTLFKKLDQVLPRGSSLWVDTLRNLVYRRSAIAGACLLSLVVLVAVFAPAIATYDPTKVLIGVEDVRRRTPPCVHLLGCPEDQPQHLLGIDGNVRDFFSRMLYGSRLSLQIGFSTVTFAIIVGTLIGAVAGYAGGWVDNVLMRLMDVILAFPYLLLAIAIVTVLGPGLTNALLAIGIVSIPIYARVTRASVLSIKEIDFVMADRAIGVPPVRILFRRILPNALTPLIVQGTLGIAVFPGVGCAATYAGMGANAERGTQPGLHSAVPGVLPGVWHHDDRVVF